MSQLKVSLCINRPKQRLLCMDTRRGCRSKRSPTPWKNKNISFAIWVFFCYFLSMGRALCYVFLLMRGFFHRMEALLLLFLYVGGLFATSSSWCGAFFTMPFLLFFSPFGGTFFMADFMSLWGFFMGLPLPPMIYFANACYYVTFIPCLPPSLTAAIMYPTKPTVTPVFNSQ